VESDYYQASPNPASLPSAGGFSESDINEFTSATIGVSKVDGSKAPPAEATEPADGAVEGWERSSGEASPAKGREAITFAMLLEKVALVSPLLRVRFSTSHPKDITDEVLHTIAKYENICNYIHLPVQSGSSRILQLMNRTYTREWYMGKVDRIKEIIPGCGISADIITGFCTEEEKDHHDTLSIMEYAQYDYSYMFYYSERPGTLAQKRFTDDVPLEVKKRRLQEVVDLQNRLSLESNRRDIGKTFKILIEGNSKKSDLDWMGRSSEGKVFVFPKGEHKLGKGDYALVQANECTQGTLLGTVVST